MSSPSQSRYSEHSHDLSPRYNRILLEKHASRSVSRHSSDHYKCTLVGSAASGACIEGSDLDILIEPRNITIDESNLIYREDIPCYVRISTEGLTGLVPSVLLSDGKYMLADPVRIMNEEIFGEIKIKDNFGQHSGVSKVGKIYNGRTVSIDLVPQLRISGLPNTARLFFTRDRSWPSDDILSLINTGEFHLAARPAPSDTDSEHDFCLSFAKAEVVLLRTMSVNQRYAIKVLKVIGRAIDAGQGVLTSYHMKTSALWHFEKTDARFWESDSPVVDILKRLDQYLQGRFLPHYFVPEMNLLVGVSESDLMYVRRRLWSLLGLCLITDGITGITSHAIPDLVVNIFKYVSKQQLRYEPHIIGNNLEALEVMYGTGTVSHIMNQRISTSVLKICPIHVTSSYYKDKCKQLLTSFNVLDNLTLINITNLLNLSLNLWIRIRNRQKVVMLSEET